MKPKFSVIMPSFLGEYKNSAKNKDEKLVRAIDSVLDQEDFELVIVADNCDKTVEIVKDKFFGYKEIQLFKIPDREIVGSRRNAGSSGIVRNAGLQQAKGEYAIYLDIDDIYIDGYLNTLSKLMTDHDWYWFDDMSWNVKNKRFDKHGIDIHTQGQCGTSNVCHKISMDAWWAVYKDTYLHDWIFINTLKRISSNYKRLEAAGYGILHVPGMMEA